MIPCSKSCLHQQDGVCMLESAAPAAFGDRDCIHYVPRTAEQNGADEKNPARESYPAPNPSRRSLGSLDENF